MSEPVTWPADYPPPWSGCPRVPILTALLDGFDEHPDHEPLVFDDGTAFTNRQLRAGAEKLAGYLRQRLNPGDRVVLAMGNRAEFIIAYLAVLANRAAVIPVSPQISAHEAEFVVRDSNAVLAITDGGTFPGRTDVLTIDGPEPHGFDSITTGTTPFDLRDVDAEIHDLVDIGYTSGTTGMPKALGGSHLETIRYMDVALRGRYAEASRDTRVLYPLQFHYGDPVTALFGAIYGGYTVIVTRRFSASRFWAVARETRATDIVTIGSIPDMLLSRPPGPEDRDHCIRSAIALAIPPSRHAELERRFGFPWREAYGSSESGPAIAMPAEFAEHYVGTGALGIPYPDVEARLVDENGEVVVGSGFGELELSGLICFEGYLNNPRANAEVMHEGWLRSGDLMRRDEAGVYYFVGRRKELIRRSGINIAPAEVEAVLRLHPDVLDAAVVPVADELMGEEIKAYVHLAPGAAFIPAELAAFVGERLSRHKVPRYLEHRVDPFPRTPTQRIPKNQLKVDGTHRVDTAWDGLRFTQPRPADR